MKKLPALLFAACWFLLSGTAFPTPQGPPVGEKPPEIRLKTPEAPNLRAYLGLGKKDTFTLSDIQAEVVVIEIFSMY